MNDSINTTATTPSGDSADMADATAPEVSAETLQEDAFRLPVKFNKQDYHLTLEEATAYAQKGMKFDTIEPMLDQLKTVAQANGLGVREFLDVLCNGDTVPVEQRLAEEFGQLREECPAVTEFSALPEPVIRTAVDEGIPLLYAYLRYEHRERARIEAASDTARRNGEASAGAQHTALSSAPDPAVEAMLLGVRGGN